MDNSQPDSTLPYKIAVLCYLYDDDGRVLLLKRKQSPNLGMYSPIGGKLERSIGEGPHDCAVREIEEETGLKISHDDVRMIGIVSESAYERQTHWLIFLFEVTKPIDPASLKWMEFSEGTLEFVAIEDVEALEIPRTDREIMWPLVQSHRGGFFVVHIDWAENDEITWVVHESVKSEGNVETSKRQNV